MNIVNGQIVAVIFYTPALVHIYPVFPFNHNFLELNNLVFTGR